MDEAERCDKVGFLFDGKLIVDDTIANLKSTLPGILLEIKSDEPLKLKKIIEKDRKPYIDMYPFGVALHILADRNQLEEFTVFSPQIIRPTLEDVFVYYLRKFRGEVSG